MYSFIFNTIIGLEALYDPVSTNNVNGVYSLEISYPSGGTPFIRYPITVMRVNFTDMSIEPYISDGQIMQGIDYVLVPIQYDVFDSQGNPYPYPYDIYLHIETDTNDTGIETSQMTNNRTINIPAPTNATTVTIRVAKSEDEFNNGNFVFDQTYNIS